MINVPNHRRTWCSLEDIIGSLAVIVLRKGLLVLLKQILTCWQSQYSHLFCRSLAYSLSLVTLTINLFSRVLVMFLFLLNQYPASELSPRNL